MRCPVCKEKLIYLPIKQESGLIKYVWAHQPSNCPLKDGLEISVIDEDLMNIFQERVKELWWVNKWKQKLLR